MRNILAIFVLFFSFEVFAQDVYISNATIKLNNTF